jgi:hypothetical protein
MARGKAEGNAMSLSALITRRSLPGSVATAHLRATCHSG